MKKNLLRVLTITCLLVMMCTVVAFADDSTTSGIFAGNAFSAGTNPEVKGENVKDIFAAGNFVSVDDSIASGNVFAAGNSVSITDVDAGADVIAAGQALNIDNTTVGGNLIAAGQNATISDGVKVDTAIIGAGTIEFNGQASYLNIDGEVVTINGIVDGDVDVTADKLYVGENAVINGKLKATTKEEPKVEPTATVGEYEYEELKDDAKATAEKVGFFAKIIKKITSLFYWIPAMVILGIVMCLVFGKNLDEAKELITAKPLEMVLFGAISWIAVPTAAVFCMITVIGFPIGMIVATVYAVLIWAGLTFAGASLARLVFPKMNPVLASVIGVAVLELVRIVPVIGTLVGIAADMYLVGYVVRMIYYKSFKKEAA